MRIFLLTGIFLLYSAFATAETSLLQELYIAPTTQTKSEAIILYDTANPCEDCAKALNLTLSILRQNYKNKLNLYLINLNKHPEFISTFNIKGPLSLVIVRIDDGATFGYNKLESLQSRIISPQLYQLELFAFINNFLGWD